MSARIEKSKLTAKGLDDLSPTDDFHEEPTEPSYGLDETPSYELPDVSDDENDIDIDSFNVEHLSISDKLTNNRLHQRTDRNDFLTYGEILPEILPVISPQ